MSMRSLKATSRTFLQNRDLAGVVEWSDNVRNPLRPLTSHAYDTDELIRWRALEAVGAVTARIGRTDPEAIREFIRRLLWLMNDESGGLCRMAPELIGETMYRVPALIDEYAPILPSFLIEEPFERGTHWALWRLTCRRKDIGENARAQLEISLTDHDPAIRALAGMILGADEVAPPPDALARVRTDSGKLSLYSLETGQFIDTTVAALVSNPPEWCDSAAEMAA